MVHIDAGGMSVPENILKQKSHNLKLDSKPYHKEDKDNIDIIILLNMNLNTRELFKTMTNMTLKVRFILESRMSIPTTMR